MCWRQSYTTSLGPVLLRFRTDHKANLCKDLMRVQCLIGQFLDWRCAPIQNSDVTRVVFGYLSTKPEPCITVYVL